MMHNVHCNSFLFFTDHSGTPLRLAFVQYSFENHEHAIQLTSHGNYKGKSPASVFRRTKPSILKRIKKDSEYKSATKVLTSIENDQGGVMNAKTGCDLPRNRQQVYNAKKTMKISED